MTFTTNRLNNSSPSEQIDKSCAPQSPTSIKCILLGDSGVGKTSLVVSYTTNDYPSEHKPSVLDTFCVEVCADDRAVNLQIFDAGGGDEVASLRHFSYSGVHVILLCFSVVKPQSFRALRQTWLAELVESRMLLNPSVTRLASLCQLRAAHSASASTPGKQPTPGKQSSSHSKSIPNGRSKSCGPSRGSSHSGTGSEIPGPAFVLVGCACDLRNDIGQLLELSKQGEEPVDPKTAERLAAEFGAEAYVECSALTQKNLKTVFDLAIWCGLRVADLGGPACRLDVRNGPVPNGTNGLAHSPGSSRKSNSQASDRTGGSGSVHSRQPQPPPLSGLPFDQKSSDKSLWRKLLCID